MMNRRLVNLAMADCKNRRFSLHRMDLSKLLFYPSTAEAEAAAAGGGHGRGGGKGKPPKIRKLRLPPPTMGFEPFPTADPFPSRDPWWLGGDSSIFVLLHGPRGEASRILFTSSEGQASMYDVDSRSVISVPDLSVPTRDGNGMPKAIVTGAGAGEEERLYVMRADGQLELLDLSGGGGDNKSRATFSTNRRGRLLWQPLPPLPMVDPYILSFTVVDSGRIICLSIAGSDGAGTFCFDTVSQEWWQAGDWRLPFHGRAEYVPELNTWLGFSDDYPDHYLCAADLSGVAMAPRQAPALQHVWEDFEPPPTEKTVSRVPNCPGIFVTKTMYWSIPQLFLVNLGSGRFCVAKVVHGMELVSVFWSMDSHEGPTDTFTVLTGVEVIRGGDGELRMVKHKSRELVHPGLDVACVL
ncbi:hypothetical protein BDA96_02G050000 [Sorghum bicolor]|uniref:Uncharacterized protein n=2 Tax=Sorghum bicolor TaxID=4558 RepID=A0A921UU84_SORBI|nr:uncharacterized protein LOC110432577 [Sorghum bicolor]KAG0541811.1 hypothetical protein BDA96_02G050000 [Sorghum bicolor]KAG0541812.1 hypothetical protein BDA96_02G050000 [Sorghum bicolor]KXG34497.1 hypothetical protein SORBI_3002G050000 [Sorghum bicolor]KXG34498.1 hypothetical protein SORBI_3002G050000 [Sorghum bicolor]|eukprot:XP_021308995.1 uncharacterized protein LOC110432577 [Sorghum bicolor]